MEQEIWKPINGYDELYEISNLGRVKSLAKDWHYGKKGDTILIPSCGDDEYLHVVLSNNSTKKTVLVHRLVALHFCDNPNGYKYVNHKNSNRQDNNAKNLEWATSSENAIHGFMFGFRIGRKGNSHHNVKLKEDDILRIRELYESKKYSQKQIGEMFGVQQTQVGRIIRKERWSHI